MSPRGKQTNGLLTQQKMLRAAAALFLEFLNKNNALLHNGEKIISDSALVAITLMVAESKPEEKEIMIALVMNFLIKN